MADCCLIKKVATVEVYENKNEVRAYGFMAGDRNTPVMEVRFKHLWGESNLSSCKLRWIIVDDVGSLLVGEVPIQSDNTALINLPNELFTGDRRMKVQLTVASCDGERILNLQQFTDLKVINSLAPNEVVEPVYDILINKLYDETFRYLKQLDDKYVDSVTKFTELYNTNTTNFTNLYDTKYASLNGLYLNSRRSLEDYMHAAENGGNANSLQGNLPRAFSRVENTIEELVNSANGKYREGDVVELLGYYTAGEGAGHKRKIEETDDGSGVQLANGLWANIVHNGEVDVSWFGDDFEHSTNHCLNKDLVLCVSKNYKIHNKIITFCSMKFYNSSKISMLNSKILISNKEQDVVLTNVYIDILDEQRTEDSKKDNTDRLFIIEPSFFESSFNLIKLRDCTFVATNKIDGAVSRYNYLGLNLLGKKIELENIELRNIGVCIAIYSNKEDIVIDNVNGYNVQTLIQVVEKDVDKTIPHNSAIIQNLFITNSDLESRSWIAKNNGAGNNGMDCLLMTGSFTNHAYISNVIGRGVIERPCYIQSNNVTLDGSTSINSMSGTAMSKSDKIIENIVMKNLDDLLSNDTATSYQIYGTKNATIADFYFNKSETSVSGFNISRGYDGLIINKGVVIGARSLFSVTGSPESFAGINFDNTYISDVSYTGFSDRYSAGSLFTVYDPSTLGDVITFRNMTVNNVHHYVPYKINDMNRLSNNCIYMKNIENISFDNCSGYSYSTPFVFEGVVENVKINNCKFKMYRTSNTAFFGLDNKNMKANIFNFVVESEHSVYEKTKTKFEKNTDEGVVRCFDYLKECEIEFMATSGTLERELRELAGFTFEIEAEYGDSYLLIQSNGTVTKLIKTIGNNLSDVLANGKIIIYYTTGGLRIRYKDVSDFCKVLKLKLKRIATVDSAITIELLNTPYHVTKMQQEGVYDDFIHYMDEKTEYDKLQRELEQQRQLAFENRENQEQTYEEWLAGQPMLLPVENEPQPSEKLLAFKEKYLG